MTWPGYEGRATWAGRFVLVIDRIVTWGMEPMARDAMLREQAADWEAMSRDRPGWPMVARQLRGIPMAIWWRLSRGEVTALPAAAADAVLGLAVLIRGLAFSEFPTSHRVALVSAACGIALLVFQLVRSPRRIVAARLRLAATFAGAGAVAAAITLPAGDGRLHTPVIDNVIRLGVAVLGVGCLALVLASVVERPRQWVLLGGGLIVVGSIVVAATEAVWGVWASPMTLPVAAVSLLIALGAGLFAHMVLRLRHLKIS